MKKVTTKLIVVLLCMLSFACKKADSSIEANNENVVLKTKVNDWLDNQMELTTNTTYKQRVKNLKEHLELSDLYVEPLNGKQNLIVIPVNDAYKTRNNKDKDLNSYLVLVQSDKEYIQYGLIMQHIVGDDIIAPKNTFANIINKNPVLGGGTFTVLTLYDKYLLEKQYNKAGVQTAEVRLNNKQEDNSNARTSTCMNWYWVTTIYWADGTTSTTTEFAFTVCGCSDGLNESFGCPDSGGGIGNGGGGGVSEATVIANYNEVKSGSFNYTTNLDNPITTSPSQTHSYRYKCADNPYGYWTVWSVAQWTTTKNGNNINVSNVSTSDEFEKRLPLLIDATTGVSYTTGTSQETPIINGNNTSNPKTTITSKGMIRVWSRIPITIFLDSDYPTKGILNINSHN
jgi:hypothetical protein